MSSRSLSDLSPACRAKAERFLDKCHAASIDVLVTCTYRGNVEQAGLYAQGRTAPGKIVTNAAPGQSPHNRTLNTKPASDAFDVVPLRNGKPMWDTKDPVWQQLGAIGRECGLNWGGDWKKFKDLPHFQHDV